MNSHTKNCLVEFINQVEGLAFAVSSVAGSDAVGGIFGAASALKSALEKDETITESR